MAIKRKTVKKKRNCMILLKLIEKNQIEMEIAKEYVSKTTDIKVALLMWFKDRRPRIYLILAKFFKKMQWNMPVGC